MGDNLKSHQCEGKISWIVYNSEDRHRVINDGWRRKGLEELVGL